MTSKQGAVASWLGSFGMPAYSARAVPDDAKLPYLTFSPVDGAWGDGEQNVSVDVWERTESEAAINARVEAMGRALGIGGALLRCDGGAVWLKRGSPFANATDSGEDGVLRRSVNVAAEFITSY